MSTEDHSDKVDSGVDWIGEVPSHWDTVRIRFVARLESGHTPSRSVDEYWEDCDIPWVTTSDIKKFRSGHKLYLKDTENKINQLGLDNSGARLLPKGTVFLSRTASVGFAGIMGDDMATSQDFANWVCGDRVIPEFLVYVFRAMDQEFSRLMQGSTHQTIYMPDIRSMQMPLPPVNEQKKIASYLNENVSRLEELIYKKDSLRNLLEEKQQAYLTHLVTQGVNAGTELKESSISVLDRLPAHWEEVKVGWLIRSMRNGWSPNAASRPAEEDEYGVLKLSAVSKGAFKPGENKALEGSTPVEDSFLIDRGDVLVTRANTPELVADACTVDTEVTDLIAPDLVFIVKVNEKRLRPQYLSEWLVTPPARAQIRADAHGSSGSMVKVSQQDFKSWQMPLPPLKEQERILEEINQIRMKSEELRESISQSISLLKEKRQALIKKAVTGQIDVIETQTPELETTT